MVDLVIKVDEDTIKMLGRKALQQQFQEYVNMLLTKAAAQEALSDLALFDELANDPEWQRAREAAWEEEKEEFEEYLPPEATPDQFEEAKNDLIGEESMGQKIESLLNRAGIYSIGQLKALPADELKAIFEQPYAKVHGYKPPAKKAKKKSKPGLT